jgi:hypothetical protein
MHYSNGSFIFLGVGDAYSKLQAVVEKFPNIEEFELRNCDR